MAVTEIKEFREEELDELLEFFRKWVPDHPELAEGKITRWQNGYHFISRYKGQIAGYLTQIPQVFKYGDAISKKGIENIGWGVTLILDMSGNDQKASLRRSAITHELLLKCENNDDLIHCGAGMIPEILDTYRRRGMIIRSDYVKMYARFFNPRKALYYLNKPAFYGFPINILNMLIPAKQETKMENIIPIKKLDKSLDNLWDDILAKQYELYGIRTSEYINYKLSQPNRNYQVYLHSDGGYIIFRAAKHRIKDFRIVKICDLVGDDRIKLELIKIAVNYAIENDVYGVVALSSNADSSIYRKAGLYISRPYLIALRPPINAKIHVTFFDADLDNLW
jgi:hypothetical protein